MTAREITAQLLAAPDEAVILGDWLVKTIQSDASVSDLAALEHAEEVQPEVARIIDGRIAAAQQRGVSPAYVWADAGRTTLARPSLLVNEVNRERERLAALVRDRIWDAIEELSGTGFEHVCDYLMDEYGMSPESRGLKGQAGDGGVDFFGVLRPYQLPGSERLYTLGRRFLGQAKRRYRGTVGPDEVEAFGSRVTTARVDNGATLNLPPQFATIDEPIVGLFLTAGSLGPSAKRAARRHVVYAIEGEQVAEDLARSSSVGEWLNDTGTSIDTDHFVAFFDEPR